VKRATKGTKGGKDTKKRTTKGTKGGKGTKKTAAKGRAADGRS
jgi:hypothetical protein